jgi:hypothetical protein
MDPSIYAIWGQVQFSHNVAKVSPTEWQVLGNGLEALVLKVACETKKQLLSSSTKIIFIHDIQ